MYRVNKKCAAHPLSPTKPKTFEFYIMFYGLVFFSCCTLAPMATPNAPVPLLASPIPTRALSDAEKEANEIKEAEERLMRTHPSLQALVDDYNQMMSMQKIGHALNGRSLAHPRVTLRHDHAFVSLQPRKPRVRVPTPKLQPAPAPPATEGPQPEPLD